MQTVKKYRAYNQWMILGHERTGNQWWYMDKEKDIILPMDFDKAMQVLSRHKWRRSAWKALGYEFYYISKPKD